MIFPDAPTGNFWQLAGSALTQGGEQANVLQDLVTRRTAAALEQKRIQDEMAQRDWEFQQKKEDDAKQEAALVRLADAAKNGVPDQPAKTTITPASTSMVAGPSPDMQDLQSGRPNALMGYNAVPMQTPEQTVTTPATMRPATQRDLNQIMLEGKMISGKDAYALTPYEEAFAKAKGTLAGYTADNHSALMGAASKFVMDKKASDPTKPPSMAEVDAAAATADPTGKRTDDKGYMAYLKSFDKDAAAQNSTSGVARLGIGQQNADAHTLEAQAAAAAAAAKNTKLPGSNLTNKEAEQRTKWGQALQNKYESSVTSTRSGTNLQAASNAFDTVNKTLAAPEISAADVTGVKDQIAKLLNPGFAISKIQFQHLNAGGLVDNVQNWMNGLKGTELLTDKQKDQYRTLVSHLGEELATAHQNIQKDFWTQAHKISTLRGWTGADSISLTPKEFSFDSSLATPQADPTSVFGAVVPQTAPTAQGSPKIGDTKLNSHGVKVVFGPQGWMLAQ